ncbi:MAG: hypothetical protein GC200_00835 [Tepidisphaera sp.]|nr:hypothetical protein [Tepidisphaera sp.]
MRIAPPTWFACALIAGAASLAQASVTYSDTEFSDSGNAAWVMEQVVIGTGGSASGVQSVFGNPGKARQVNLTTGSAGGDTIWGFSRYGIVMANRYDPFTQGAITSITWSIDARLSGGGFGDGQAVELALKQGQIIYGADYHVTGSSGNWITLGGSGITAADFHRLDGQPGSPNFSATGAPIRFGFASGNSTTGGAYATEATYDNWSVIVNPVPAPGACLAFAGLAGFAGLRRRGR